MQSRDFCYWLQGFFEVSDVTEINEKQTQQIKNHLNLVFKHEIDPSIDLGNKEKTQQLGEIHNHKLPFGPTNSNEVILRC